MKFFKFLSLFVVTGFFLLSCQKELSYEDGATRGSLVKDAFGDCAAVQPSGIYKQDSALGANNFVDVQINATTTGTYDIKTDTVNGYSFRAVGVVTIPGLNSVRLIGSGKPLLAGTDVFRVRFDTSVCEINIDVALPGSGGGTTAVFTLGSTAGSCTGGGLSGTYTSGIAMTAANTANIGVTVQTAGSYTISTTTANGVTFSGTGNVALGTTSITLIASGTPAASATPVTSSYNITSGTSTCGFTITYAATPPPATFTVNCTGAVASGTYTQGVAMTASNTYTIAATSTGAGSYSITTASVNGVTFTATGTFAGATTQPIMLIASGTPAASGAFNYTTAGGTGSCPFTVNYGTAPQTNGVLTFKLDAATTATSYSLNTSADTTGVTSPTSGFGLDIFGQSPANEDFNLILAKSGAYFTAGTTYTVNQLLTGVGLSVTYTDASGDDYTIATTGTNQTPGFSITISTLTATRATGTFSGTVTNATGATHVLNNGIFDLPLQ